MKNTSLSKSRYTKYCQCPKALWLNVNKPDEATVDPGVEARFAEGNVVGDLAMGLFGDYVEVTAHTADGRLDLGAMIERTREEMADAYPDLATHLMNIHGNIIDLLIPFRDGHCYTPAMGGSFSIKSVLPALFPDDDELNYHNLNPLVQNGGHAMTIFPQIKDMEPEKAAEAREALLAYCHLDTLAMVRVWERLRELV